MTAMASPFPPVPVGGDVVWRRRDYPTSVAHAFSGGLPLCKRGARYESRFPFVPAELHVTGLPYGETCSDCIRAAKRAAGKPVPLHERVLRARGVWRP